VVPGRGPPRSGAGLDADLAGQPRHPHRPVHDPGRRDPNHPARPHHTPGPSGVGDRPVRRDAPRDCAPRARRREPMAGDLPPEQPPNRGPRSAPTRLAAPASARRRFAGSPAGSAAAAPASRAARQATGDPAPERCPHTAGRRSRLPDRADCSGARHRCDRVRAGRSRFHRHGAGVPAGADPSSRRHGGCRRIGSAGARRADPRWAGVLRRGWGPCVARCPPPTPDAPSPPRPAHPLAQPGGPGRRARGARRGAAVDGRVPRHRPTVHRRARRRPPPPDPRAAGGPSGHRGRDLGALRAADLPPRLGHRGRTW